LKGKRAGAGIVLGNGDLENFLELDILLLQRGLDSQDFKNSKPKEKAGMLWFHPRLSLENYWSGRLDLNQRPLEPHSIQSLSATH
jgi:hypothetical protein